MCQLLFLQLRAMAMALTPSSLLGRTRPPLPAWTTSSSSCSPLLRRHTSLPPPHQHRKLNVTTTALFGGKKAAPKVVRQTVIPEPDYRVALTLLGTAGALVYSENLLPAAPIGLLGLLLLVQTTRVRFVFDDEGLGKRCRRHALLTGGLLPVLLLSFPSTNSAAVVTPARIDLSRAPSHPFDAGDRRLREAAALFQKALSAPTVEEEERLWTQVIDSYGKLDAEWVPDIVSRAWGNRGNSRSRQGKMDEALADFDRSIELAPYAADPVLNRGVTLESLGRYDEAAADYQAVLLAQPNDPAAWNNLGNVKAAMGQFDEALSNYRRAVQIAPEFSFAAANYGLILYQVGKENEAFKQFRSLLRKYPEFPDVRAALAVTLYAQGLTAEAETNWGQVEDGRYRDRNWVRYTRKWPPRLMKALEGFLDVKAVAK